MRWVWTNRTIWYVGDKVEVDGSVGWVDEIDSGYPQAKITFEDGTKCWFPEDQLTRIEEFGEGERDENL